MMIIAFVIVADCVHCVVSRLCGFPVCVHSLYHQYFYIVHWITDRKASVSLKISLQQLLNVPPWTLS